MSVDVSTNPAFKTGTPKRLFSVPILGGPGASSAHFWDIAPDGQRFLINVAPENTASVPMTVVVNWTAGLKK
jgi:hypothetical protein